MSADWDIMSESDDELGKTISAALDLPETESSDSDAHVSEGYLYGRREIKGTRYQEWIDGNNRVRCPVKPATLVLNEEEMERDETSFNMETLFNLPLSSAVAAQVANLNLGPGPGPNGEVADVRVWQRIPVSPLNPEGAMNRWVGGVGKGFLCMSEIFRLGAGSFSSDIYQAIYKRFYPIDTLSTCFVTSIINVNTRKFLDRLYKAHGLPCPQGPFAIDGDNVQEICRPRFWAHGTPEYKALLGTRIGGVVATLVLGSFPRGTKRIVGIQTLFKCNASKVFTVDMRFDIRDSN